MSVQPVPPSSGPTTAGQLAARATQNDQALAAAVGAVGAKVDGLQLTATNNGNGTATLSLTTPSLEG